MKTRVLINNETDNEITAALESRIEACARLLLEECEDCYEVGLTIVSEETIRALNREFRDKDEVTDVLSFALYDEMDEEEAYIYLGDSVLCYARARSQADDYGHSIERELVYLFAHSLLHMLGYDHETEEDRQRMRQKEEETMQKLALTREKHL
jgi:probable rRNA maturation factor